MCSILCLVAYLSVPSVANATSNAQLSTVRAQATTVNVFDGDNLQNAIRNATDGQTIVVHAGNYGDVYVSGKTFSSTVTVMGAPGETAVIRSIALYLDSNITFSNLTVTGTYQDRTCNHMTITNSSVTAVQVRDGSQFAVVSNNTIANGFDGVWVRNINNAPPVDNVTITGNNIFGQTDDAITMGIANHVLIAENTIHDTIDTANHNDGVQVSGGTDVTITRNRFWNHDEAIILKAEPSLGPTNTVSAVTISNNLIYRSRGAGIILAGGTNGIDVVNNTLADNPFADVHLEAINNNVRIWNNVMKQLFFVSGANMPTLENYNCVQSGGSGTRDIVADPAFVDNVDFRLSPASPCRATGQPIDAPPVDFAGATRTTPWDIGAWQNSAAGAVAPADVFPGDSLEGALRRATPGSTITVHSGAYPAISLTQFNFAPAINLVAATGEIVHIGGLTLTNVGGLHIDGVQLDGPLSLTSSRDISLSHGSAASISMLNGTNNVTISNDAVTGGVSATNISGAPTNSRITVEDSTIDAPTVNGILLASATQTAIQDNVISMSTDNSSFNTGIRITGGDGNVIERNRISGFDQSVSVTSAGNTHVENNLITASRGAGILSQTATNTTINNNTVVGNTQASLDIEGNNRGLSVYNNVLDQLFLGSGVSGIALENYNCVRSGGTGNRDIISDPSFVNRVDFQLASNSPCRGTATATGAATTDLSLAPRTMPIDIGAWQNSPAATGPITDVFSTGSLESAIRQASPGQTITIHTGDYAGFSLTGFIWNVPVQVIAAPDNVVTIGGVNLTSVTGLHFSGVTFGSPFTLTASHDIAIANSTLTSVAASNGSSDISITGNQIVGGSTGISLSNTTTTPHNSNISITNNIIRNQSINGISLGVADGVAITSNTIDGSVDTASFNVGIRIDGGNNVLISRNNISGFDQSMSIQLASNLDSAASIHDARIENNITSHSRGAGIAILGGTDQTDIVNNTSFDNVYADIQLQGVNTNAEVWNNIANRFYVVLGSSLPTFEDYNLFVTGGSGNNDVHAPPIFVDHVLYQQDPASPGIGIGTSTNAPTIDFIGDPRTPPIDAGAWQSA